MIKKLTVGLIAALSLVVVLAGSDPGNLSPGRRTMVLGHHAFAQNGIGSDRFDRLLGTGTPFAVELDLFWGMNPKTGKNESVVGSTTPALTGNEPRLKPYFFEKVRPIMEKALKENKKADWPLITLYLDIRDGRKEHLQEVWNQLGEYEPWLTTAVKSQNESDISPLDVKPMLLLVGEKAQKDTSEYFYNQLPVGGKIRVFGTALLALPPVEGLSTEQAAKAWTSVKPEVLIPGRSTNFRRWCRISCEMIEGSEPEDAGAWSPVKEARLKALVNQAHKMGYLVNVWLLNGHEPGKEKMNSLGWFEEYNFGSLQKATIRWEAAIKAGVDFISTDQYEEVAKVTHGRH